MSDIPIKARLKWLSNLGFEAKIKEFPPIILDEPPDFKGDDRGPSAVEMLLVGIGGCIGTSFVYCLKRFGVKFKALDLDVSGEIHHVPPDLLLRITRTHIVLKITPLTDSQEDREQIESCFDYFAKYCIVSKSVEKGIPFDLDLNFAEPAGTSG
ncbi:MAG: OsmC family protein [Candidatus Helarchaeota archaeon]